MSPTLGARDISSAVSGFCQIFIVTRAKSDFSRGFGRHQKFPPHARKTSGTHARVHEPGCQDEFRLGFIWEISAQFPWWKKAKDPWDEFRRQIRETKQTYRNTKILTFALIIASATLESVSLPLNGMLMIWKMQQATQDDAIPTARIHPDIYPCNRAEVFIWQKKDRKNLSELFVDEKIFQIRKYVLAHRWLRRP